MVTTNKAARVHNLVLKASKGDQQAFGDLYEMYLDQIYRYIYFRVGNQQDTEDLTETCFVRAWQTLYSGKSKNQIRNFNAWIYRIAQNLITDHFRKKKPLLIEELSETFQTKSDSVEDVLIQDAEFAELFEAMNLLDERSYQVIQLRFLSQMSHAETAVVLELDEGHIRVLQYRALKKLRNALAKD